MICLAFRGHFGLVAGFDLNIRPVGADSRGSGLSDCFFFRRSHLLKTWFATNKHKEDFVFARIYNRAFLGGNKGQF